MSKSEDEVVKEFNEIVNMTAKELETFLKTGESGSAGWTADGGSGETVGHESGRKIVDILKRNPKKEPSKYTDEDKAHMRKVVSYCKRHLAQEGHMKETKSPEELEHTKSTISLKNWGHDPMKTLKGGKPSSKKKAEAKPEEKEKKAPASKGKPASKKEEKPALPKKEENEKPASKAKESKEEPASAKKEDKPAEKPKSKGKTEAKPVSKGKTGEKRAAEEKEVEKPASKKAKTDKPASTGKKPASKGAAKK